MKEKSTRNKTNITFIMFESSYFESFLFSLSFSVYTKLIKIFYTNNKNN